MIYISFKLAAITWGDPHLKTLDGSSYTFNGHGEYWMVDTEYGISGFQLQARTERALDKYDQPTQATVFSGFAARDNETTTVQVQMSADKQCKYSNWSMSIIYIQYVQDETPKILA